MFGGNLRRTASSGSGFANPQAAPGTSAAAVDSATGPSGASLKVPTFRSQLPPPYDTPKVRLNVPVNGQYAMLAPSNILTGTPRWRSRVSMLATSLLLMAAVLYVVVLSYSAGSRSSIQGPTSFGLVIDAGSSGSRIHVFRYRPTQPVPHVLPSSLSLKIRPGLSSYADKPEEAGQSLIELVEFAQKHVPQDYRHHTPIFLFATAGLRRLDNSVKEQILDSCRKRLAHAGFLFQPEWARVISGTSEGVYAWVAANYALGNIGLPSATTAGVIELGGASAQLTFVPEVPPPPEFRYDLTIAGVSYTLYAHSFLHFGQEAAHDEVFTVNAVKGQQDKDPALDFDNVSGSSDAIVDPCLPSGYPITSDTVLAHAAHSAGGQQLLLAGNGTQPVAPVPRAKGHFGACRRAAVELLQRDSDSCAFRRCPIGGAFIPALQGDFFATENFYYTAQFFGLRTSATLGDWVAAGERYCGLEWEEVKALHSGVPVDDLAKYCFSASYITALLHDGLGVGMEETRLRFTNSVGSVPVDWALGALIEELSSGVTAVEPPPWLWIAGGVLGVAGLTLAVIIAALLAVRACWDRRRTSAPTIYDLEKGRYFMSNKPAWIF